uniref:Luciferin 4-monooxygenase n=1 Tax=Corethrella appendiculata TaxID=1370023 RepID=U5EJG4_9DIPT
MLRNFYNKFTNLNTFTKYYLRLNNHEKKYQKQFLKYLSTNPKAYIVDSVFPQENEFVQSSIYDENFLIPKCRIEEYIWDNIQNWQEKTAMVCGITGRNYNYAKLRDYSAATAIRLQQKFNLKSGDVVGICLPNIPEFPICCFGAIEADLIVTTVNPIYTAHEISKQILDSQAKVMFCTVEKYSVLEEAVKLSEQNIPIICIKTDKNDILPRNSIDFFELMDTKGIDFSSLQKPIRDHHETVTLPYSSGTTGLPKGVMLSHTNLISNCEMLKVNTGKGTIVLPTTDSYQDVLPCVLPFFHIYGFTVTLMSKLNQGCKMVTLPGFRPDTFLNALAEHKGSVLNLVPPIIIFLTNFEGVQNKHTQSIRNIFSGAAPLAQSDAEMFLKKVPHVDFVQGYGLTETSPVVLFQSVGSTNYASIGAPCPKTQAKIVSIDDPTFTALGANQCGELLVRGPQTMKGYHNNEKATKETLVENGWLRTGDISYYDENGQFYITDRLKELIKVKGFQVPPAELEALLRSHNEIADAAVVGKSHPIDGERPVGFVVLKKNSTLNEENIKKFVAEKVAAYKKIDEIIFLEAIPKNPTGKIIRKDLKAKYCS